MAFQYQSVPSKLAQRIMKYSGGLIKTEDQANYVALGLAAAAFIIAAYLFYGSARGPITEFKVPPGYHIVHPEDGGLERLEKDSNQ